MKNNLSFYTKALFQATKNASPEEITIILKNFVELLAKKQQLGHAEKIITTFQTLAKKENGITEATVVTARVLEAEEKENVINSWAGKSLKLKEVVDKNLIGGLIFKTSTTILDGSIRTQLELLKSKLIE